MKERVLFLQLAGTIVPHLSLLAQPLPSDYVELVRSRIQMINQVCLDSRATLVLNIDALDHHEVCVNLIAHGLVVNNLRLTDRFTRYPKLNGEEAVKEWLSRHPDINWVALDADFNTDEPRFITTTSDIGLCKHHIDLVEELFENHNSRAFA